MKCEPNQLNNKVRQKPTQIIEQFHEILSKLTKYSNDVDIESEIAPKIASKLIKFDNKPSKLIINQTCDQTSFKQQTLAQNYMKTHLITRQFPNVKAKLHGKLTHLSRRSQSLEFWGQFFYHCVSPGSFCNLIVIFSLKSLLLAFPSEYNLIIREIKLPGKFNN